MTAILRHTLSRRLWIVGVAVLSVALLGGREMRAQTRDTLPRYVFTVEIEGIGMGAFREISGLGVETEVIEFRDGNTNDVRKLPGRQKWPDIVLKRGFTGNSVLYDWATTYARTGTLIRRSGTITVYDQSGAEVSRYHFENAWPVKWYVPELNSDGNEVAVETLVLAHEGLRLAEDDR
jgi:phage tail-like protein